MQIFAPWVSEEQWAVWFLPTRSVVTSGDHQVTATAHLFRCKVSVRDSSRNHHQHTLLMSSSWASWVFGDTVLSHRLRKSKFLQMAYLTVHFGGFCLSDSVRQTF